MTLEAFLGRCNREDLRVAGFSMESEAQIAQRFLDGRGGDVDKALKLLMECVALKKSMNVAQIKQQTPEQILDVDFDVLRHFYPHGATGHDKLNRPLLFEHSGGIDINAVLHLTTLERLRRFHLWSIEVRLDSLFSACAALPDNPLQTVKAVAVTDLSNLTMSHCSAKFMEHLKSIIAIDNVCYPETLGCMVLVNTPKIAVGAFKMLRAFLDKKTQKKIELLSSGRPSIDRLKELIDEDVLPESMGGKGPNPYTSKPHTAFIKIGASTDFTYRMDVPAHHALKVDSYIKDASMSIRVQEEGQKPEEAPLHIEKMMPPEGGVTMRRVIILPAAQSDRSLFVTWRNDEKWYGRHLVYSVSLLRTPPSSEKGNEPHIFEETTSMASA